MDLAARIAELSDLHGPPGREGPVRRRLRALLPAGRRAVSEDALGSLFVRLGGGGARRLLVLVPMDEPALVVTHIDARGRAAAAPLGAAGAALAGQRVVLPSGALAAVGVRRARGEGEGPLGPERLYLDFGVRRREDLAGLAAVGDPAVPDVRAARLPGGAVCGKALGARAACAAALAACAGAEPAAPAAAWDVTVAFLAQSALGQRGVAPAVARCPADLLLSLGPAAAGTGPARGGRVALGAGPVLIVSDRGLVASAPAVDALAAAAARAGVALQAAVADPGTTGAGPALAAAAGAPAGALAFPLRHGGTTAEVCEPADVAGLAGVLAALFAGPA